METCISAVEVKKTYGKTVALNDISLELKKGEILALLGSNGSGKTTLIKILATLLVKDSGRVEISGYNLDTHTSIIRHLFGYVGQDTERSAYARLTVKENLLFFGSLRGLKNKQINERIDELANYFDFSKNLNKLFMHLSGGQKQTVVIMRALLHNPTIIYLDEPTKGLDPIIAHKMRSFLKNYVKSKEKSLLITSHILSEVEELADRVTLIHMGRNLITGTPDQLKEEIGVPDFIELKKDTLPIGTIDRINNLNSVRFTVERELGWISFGVSDFYDGMEQIIKILQEDKIQTSFRHHSVSLEDAFIHHIGILDEKFEA
jgi:ABC-2 type transport system ATP-binding protein